MSAPEAQPPGAARVPAWVDAAALAALFCALAAWTWRAWPDPVVDFGRELYVPWRLAEGERLFRDLAWFNGPLSPHWNALLFRIFGVGLGTLIWTNMVLLALTVWLAHGILMRLAGRAAAFAGAALFLACFAFGQLVGIGNYNWLAPYSHEATHGLVLALACFAALERWRSAGRERWLVVGGLALGLDFLTKPETFLAAAAAAIVLLALPRAGRPAGHGGGGPRVGPAVRFAGAALLPPLAAFGLLATSLSVDEALRGTLGAWPSVLAGKVGELAFYRAGMGLDDPGARLVDLARRTGGWLLVLAPLLGCAWFAGRRRGLVAAGAALAVGACLWLAGERIAWLRAARPLPLAALVIGAAAALRWLRSDVTTTREGGATRERAARTLAFAALALALLLKMLLQARTTNYGFTLALPATLLVAAALVGWVPEWLDGRGRSGAVFRAGAAAALLVFAAAHLIATGGWLARKTVTVGRGTDAFRADARGEFVNAAVESVREGEARTMAVLPEGVLLNYLARVPNPTPYVNFMPPELILFGEEAWLEAFAAAPPDVVLYVHKDTSEYGYPYFGTDYAVELDAWVRATYRPIGLMGQEPLQPGTGFGVRLFARGKQP